MSKKVQMFKHGDIPLHANFSYHSNLIQIDHFDLNSIDIAGFL